MSAERCSLIISSDVAREIAALASRDSLSRRTALNMLRETQMLAKHKQKQIHIYCLTVGAVRKQYERRIYSARQFVDRTRAALAEAKNHHAHLLHERQSMDRDMSTLEDELQACREYVQRRRDKKARREQEYNRLYFVPLVSNQYKRKYMRARDKNANAEQQLSDIREDMDACQDAIRESMRRVNHQLAEVAELETRESEAVADARRLDETVDHLEQGRQFWDRMDGQQIAHVLESSQQLIQQLRTDQGPETHWLQTFQMACLEYAESVAYGDRHWGSQVLDFDCSRCHASVQGWPSVDKVRTTELLCSSCYQSTRTTMIVEKKFNAFGEKLGFDRAENRRSSVDSRQSNRSSFLGDAKPKVKKMFKNVFKSSSALPQLPPLPPPDHPSSRPSWQSQPRRSSAQQPPQPQRPPFRASHSTSSSPSSITPIPSIQSTQHRELFA